MRKLKKHLLIVFTRSYSPTAKTARLQSSWCKSEDNKNRVDRGSIPRRTIFDLKMEQKEIKYIYEIESTLDLDNVIDSLHQELELKEGILRYFSLSKDDLIEEKLPMNELKTKALEVNSNEEYPSIIFPNVEVNVDENRIEVLSKIKLNLKDVDVDNVIEK